MKRRRYLAALSTAMLAGCSGDGGDGTAEPTDEPSPTPTEPPTPAEIPEQTSSPSGEFDPEITFTGCNEVTIEGAVYPGVGFTLPGNETETFTEGPYSGENTFESDSVIEAVVVVGYDNKSADRINPNIEQCLTTPTPDPYNPETARENAREPTYDEFFRNFEEYEGDPIRFKWGRIYQTIYEDSYDYYQMYVGQNDTEMEGDIAATWVGDTRYLEDDWLNPVVGVAERLQTYTTTQGDERTIPRVRMVYAELDEE